MSNCDCKTRENDVCPNCVDSQMDEIYQSMIDGTAGKELIDIQIEIKSYLLSIITTPEFVKKTSKEIEVLKMLRERQHDD